MRPHALRLTAFGPFAGTVEVDLDALAAGGLFLLHGPTGAGKTTLLDGIGFALFGTVPGARGGAKRLRSDHAAAGLRTEVQLEATLLGRRVRVTRSPAWERAKSRGVGTTTEPAKVLLEERIGEDWITLSTRPREADDQIADLVGMSAEQFFQVVLLPQGEFARFLRAGSVERAALLQKLFATGRFADVEAWLAGRRRSTAEQVASARGDLGRIVARVAEVAGEEVPDAGEPDLAWAAELLAAAVRAQEQASTAVADATAVRESGRVVCAAAVDLRDRQQRRAGALARQADLRAQEPVVRQLKVEAEAADRAAEVAGALAAAAGRRAVRDRALDLEQTARAQLLVPTLALDDLTAAVAAAQERLGQLDALRALDATRSEAVDEAARARDEQADALAAAAAAELTLAVLPTRRDAAAAQVEAARTAAAQVPALRAERDRLVSLRPDLVALAQLRPLLQQLTEQSISAREEALALEQKALDLRVATTNSMIARLAAHLVDGVPCDVCGSLEHPDPSALSEEAVSTDDEDRARRAADQAQEVVAAVLERLATTRATERALSERLGDLTLASLDDQVAALDLDLDVRESTSAQLETAEAVVADLEAQREQATTAQVAAATRAEAAGRRAAAAESRAAAAAGELAQALAPDLDLAAAVDRTTRLRESSQAALTAGTARESAQQDLDRALHDAESACGRAGFATSDAALLAQRAVEWRAGAQAQLRGHADLVAAVTAELADPALDVDLDPPAPVTQAAAALAEADQLLAAASQQLGQASSRREALERLVPALAEASIALVPLEEQARQVRGLADLCAGAGANGLKMTLAAFVLAARLEEVAEAATTRLLRMTQGRYSLLHTDGAARGGLRSGLELLVRDAWSGQDRDTATLSGGETFLASLALALGLADVVSAEAGGARIGALFVDEGFGTLDEDTLEEVMGVLDGLREGGRVVGVVSHVAELRQRITTHVEVIKTRHGSDLVLHGC